MFLTEMQSSFPEKSSPTLFICSSAGTVGQKLGACAAVFMAHVRHKSSNSCSKNKTRCLLRAVLGALKALDHL